jgi:serine/threonine protein kinase
LTNGSTVKLGDFGLSKLISAHDFASTYVGTPFYMSPEICSSERYSGKSDIWSLGCILYELCALEPPFNARSHLELIQKIRVGRTKPLPTHFSKELGQVISSCLRINPDERPDTAQLLQVGPIKFARMKLESETAYSRGCIERDALLERVKSVEKENQSLRDEVTKLKGTESHLKMEWHAKATLAIEARVEEEKQKLRGIFEAEVENRTEMKLTAHLASLPAAEGVSVNVRSSTPPPESNHSSFTTAPTTVSSPERSLNDGDIDTDLTSLSLGDDVSPLAQRTKPMPRKTGRTPFTRAKTVASAYPGSPMDVQMADRSPMPPNSLRGLALSPRRDNRPRDGLLGQAVRRNIFAEANKLKPITNSSAGTHKAADEDTSFADDLLDDDEEPYSPSRPTSAASNTNGDPFKALGLPGIPSMAPPTRRPGPRPSLERQKTMPAHLPQATNQRRNTLFTNHSANDLPALPKSTTMSNLTAGLNCRENTKENRPPSAHSRTNTVPILATSPKRTALPQKKELTPSRQAPRAPGNKTPAGAAKKAGDLMKCAQRNALQGRTLVELSQAPGSLLPASPVKWEQEMMKGEVGEMPSPFLARKGRQIG